MATRVEQLIRVVYKNGYIHDFWAYDFEGQTENGQLSSLKWSAVDLKNGPIFIGITEIASIWVQDWREAQIPEVAANE